MVNYNFGDLDLVLGHRLFNFMNVNDDLRILLRHSVVNHNFVALDLVLGPRLFNLRMLMTTYWLRSAVDDATSS